MELFLNLCWLALVLPAYLLWRQRASGGRSLRQSLVVVGALTCALMLLFPVISASDDLHAAAQAIDESERSFRHGSQRVAAAHISHTSPVMALVPTSSRFGLEQAGSVELFSTHAAQTSFASAIAGRSPPFTL